MEVAHQAHLVHHQANLVQVAYQMARLVQVARQMAHLVAHQILVHSSTL